MRHYKHRLMWWWYGFKTNLWPWTVLLRAERVVEKARREVASLQHVLRVANATIKEYENRLALFGDTTVPGELCRHKNIRHCRRNPRGGL